MSTTQPVLSIVTPTYQRLTALRRSLPDRLMLVEQLGPRVELVVSDNASTDGTWDYLQEVCAGRPGVRIRREPLLLPSEPHFLNSGATAKGRYLLWLADDDAIYPEHFAALVDLLETAERPFYYLPFEGVTEPDQANPAVLRPDGPLAVRELPTNSLAAALILHATAFRSTSVWRLEVLRPYFERWPDWIDTCYCAWWSTLDVMADQETLCAFDKLFGYGNRWDDIEKRVPLLDVCALGRLKVWAGLHSLAMRRTLAPVLAPVVVAGLADCPGWRAKLAGAVKLGRVAPSLVLRGLAGEACRRARRRLGLGPG
jgi:glycosyltransferase involved in cell wall biosynthesis